MSLSPSPGRFLSLPRSFPSGAACRLCSRRRDYLDFYSSARPRSLRVGRFTVHVTSALTPSFQLALPPPFPLSRATGIRFYITFHYSRAPINPSSAALFSRPARSRSTSTRDFYDSFRVRVAISRDVRATSSRGGMIEPLSSLGGCEGFTTVRSRRDRDVTRSSLCP